MANVAKFAMKDTPRLLTHCARTQKNPGSHIHQERTQLNYNLADGMHPGMTDYQFLKARTHQEGVRMLNRGDVKPLCDWAVTYPKDLCHEIELDDGSSCFIPNDEEDCRKFFEATYDFLAGRHGAENVVSAYVHMDENMPHIHFAFVPIVKDKDGMGEKVCAKEALKGCYGAAFQVDLQDYIASQLGHEVHMVRKETEDYERNVKDLKRRTLNSQMRILRKEISALEEEVECKRRVLKRFDRELDAMDANPGGYDVTVRNGVAVMREAQWEQIQIRLRSLEIYQEQRAAMAEELEALEKNRYAVENAELKDKNGELERENSALAKKQAKSEQEIAKMQDFMGTIQLDSGRTALDEFNAMQAKGRKKKESHDDGELMFPGLDEER